MDSILEALNKVYETIPVHKEKVIPMLDNIKSILKKSEKIIDNEELSLFTFRKSLNLTNEIYNLFINDNDYILSKMNGWNEWANFVYLQTLCSIQRGNCEKMKRNAECAQK